MPAARYRIAQALAVALAALVVGILSDVISSGSGVVGFWVWCDRHECTDLIVKNVGPKFLDSVSLDFSENERVEPTSLAYGNLSENYSRRSAGQGKK
jgi:hypothetical protein